MPKILFTKNFFVVYLIEESNMMTVIMRLFIFAVLALVGITLWTKAQEKTKQNSKPADDFKQQYADQKRQEFKNRL